MLCIADELHWNFIESTLKVEGLYEVVSEVFWNQEGKCVIFDLM